MYEDTKVENVAKLYKVKSGRLWGEGGGTDGQGAVSPAHGNSQNPWRSSRAHLEVLPAPLKDSRVFQSL